MTLLDNELVRDYFKSKNCIHAPMAGICDGCFALRILRAMQEPIKEGERYLEITMNGQVLENVAQYDLAIWANYLRLPDRFQKQECPNVTVTCSCGMIIDHPDIATRRY